MSKTILQMLFSSRNTGYYILIMVIPVLVLSILLYNNVLNFTILLLVDCVAISSSLVMSLELLLREDGTKIYSYLKTLKSENYIMMYRTVSIFVLSSVLTIIVSLVFNLIYIKDIYIIQQLIYLVLILLANFFYIYFLQYLSINVTNILIRNSIVTIVTAISLLSLMTRNLASYTMYVTITGLFLAVTFMNKRLTEELKRDNADKMHVKK